MGGIGKTTLAKSIYNNQTIQQHFDVKVWLCVSVKTEVDKLLANIYESLAGEECKSQLRPNLIANLHNQLGSKRYLLVLDDVWDEERAYWDDFKTCMLKVKSQSGSGILVTTRNLEIGTKAMTEDFHALQSLSDDRCWSIFKERAFVVGQSPLPELEEIGRDIVKRCHGLPLLLHVIGGTLRNYNDKEMWLSIRDNKVWDMEEGVRVQNSLKLSFDNLPNSIVKQCFLYCSFFKKNTVLEREELIRLWMALGFLQVDERRKKEAEDVGNDIFQILVSSSLFQDVKTDENGYVTCCMHDLVHDLSVSLSEHESFCLVEDQTSHDIPHIPQVKHLAIFPKERWPYVSTITFNKIISVLFKNDMTTRTLQTLIIEGVVKKNVPFQSFKYMKILKLRRCALTKIDDLIGELVHLKYLDLSHNDFKVLPKSIGKLHLLQTLKLLRCYRLEKLPQEISNLTSLRHLIYGSLVKDQEAFEWERGDDYVPEFPIRNVGRLTSLRTLPSFKVGREKGYQIEELGRLKHLAGELCITNLGHISNKEDAARADLSKKKFLYGIHFSCEGVNNQNQKDVFEGLQPHGDVRSLTIEKFSGDNFPEWITKMAIDTEGKWTPLDKLVKIRLSKCTQCTSLPVLEHLPLLRDLELVGMDNLTCLISHLGKGFNVTRSMKPLSPSLRSLRLDGMTRLEKWIDAATTNNSTMLSPVLESLSIFYCPKITHLNECYPHPLVSLEIYECENLVSINSIQGLTSLESLVIEGCPTLSEIGFLQNYKHHPLKHLRIYDNKILTSLPRFDCFSFLKHCYLVRSRKSSILSQVSTVSKSPGTTSAR